MIKKSLLVVLAVLFCSLPAVADDNQIYMEGGVIAVERVTGTPTQWFATLSTSRGPIKILCTGSAVSDCSALTSGSIPVLLNTGGCLPLFEASSGNSHVWACDGSGTGLCREMGGWLQGNNFVSFVTPTASSSGSCN